MDVERRVGRSSFSGVVVVPSRENPAYGGGLGGDEGVRAVREGQGLLVGLLRCGHCGRRMHVRYWGRKGTHGRYACKGDYDTGGRYCNAFGGGLVDRRFSEQLLEVISPLGMEASLQAVERLESKDDERHQARLRKLEQLEYETQRAFEQYDEVDLRWTPFSGPKWGVAKVEPAELNTSWS